MSYLFLDAKGKMEYIEYLERELGIKKQEDWKNVETSKLLVLKRPPKWG
jgi:hypothetical protein